MLDDFWNDNLAAARAAAEAAQKLLLLYVHAPG